MKISCSPACALFPQRWRQRAIFKGAAATANPNLATKSAAAFLEGGGREQRNGQQKCAPGRFAEELAPTRGLVSGAHFHLVSI
jgi:hypothetical protein